MESYPPAPVPRDAATLEELRRAAADCHGCDLWEQATQTVFGEGAPRSRLMLVGEQPGDKEDLLRAPDAEARRTAYAGLVDDLRRIADAVGR